jgi:hypothetical protein
MMFSRKTPPCPGNPEDYVLVKSKEGLHWRKKRGTVKPAQLNTAFEANASAMKIVSPAAKQIAGALRHYLHGISTGRLNVRIGNALRRSLKEQKQLRLCYLKGIELQAEHPMDDMLTTRYNVFVQPKTVRVEITIARDSIKPLNKLTTHYYFEAVLLYGDINKEKGLKTESIESPLYAVGDKAKTVCVLKLDLPKKEDWCLILKLSSLEGNELAGHTKHYRMKVVGACENK